MAIRYKQVRGLNNTSLNKMIDISGKNLVDKNYVDNAISKVTVDTSDLATKTELNKKVNTIAINMSNLGQDVKEAMTGGSVAVVGNNCVGEDNLTLKLKENICEGEIKYIQENVEYTHGFYNYSTGVYEDLSSSELAYYEKTFSVIPNEIYYVSGRASGSNAALCVFFDANKSYLGYALSFTDEGHIIRAVNEKVTTPAGAKYMSVVTNNKEEFPVTLMKKEYSIIDISSILKDNFSEEITTNVDVPNQTNGIYKKDTGTYEDFSTNSALEKYSSAFIKVNPSEKFLLTTKIPKPNSSAAVFFDITKTYISYVDNDTQTVTDFKFKTPENCYYMAIGTSDKYNNPIKLKKYVNKIVDINANKTEINNLTSELDMINFENEYMKNKLVKYNKNNEFAWKDYTKGYVTFVFDDGRHDISTVVNLFKTNNVPLCLAIPSDTLENTCDNGKKVKEVCLDLQDNGGEILSHSTDVQTFKQDTTDEEALYRIRTSKYLLTKAGLNIRGMIKPGGIDSISNLGLKWDDIIRIYYEYGDEIGLSIPYVKGRKGMATRTLNEIKTLIDTAATTNSWVILYGHTLDGTEASDFDSSKMQSVLDYVKSKTNIEVVTYSTMIDTNGTTDILKRIEALENRL